ncbi:MAG: hypothetical protein HQ557_04285 [Bacteroidetes bacterium]|nr:hypothetical protein [Bacteroidota bacterium]
MSIKTITGPIDEKEAGFIAPHEHIFIDISHQFITPDAISKRRLAKEKVSISNLDVLSRNPFLVIDNLILDDEETAIDEVLRFKNAGGGTLTDVTPSGIGRDPEALHRVSVRTGIHVVAGCGYYTGDTHPDALSEMSINDLADSFLTDIEVGIEGTRFKAGVIGEIGTSKVVSKKEKKVVAAAAVAQKKSGLGVHIHTYPWGNRGLEVIELMKKHGCDIGKVVIDHIDVEFDMDYCRSLMNAGAFIEFDDFSKEFYIDSFERKQFAGGIFVTDYERVLALKQFVDDGYTDHILITCDICLKTLIHRYGGWGYDHILAHIIPMMREVGVKEKDIETIVYRNPVRLLGV